MTRLSRFMAVSSMAVGAALFVGCASDPQSNGQNENAQPAAARMNATPATLPYNGGVYDLNGPYHNAGNND